MLENDKTKIENDKDFVLKLEKFLGDGYKITSFDVKGFECVVTFEYTRPMILMEPEKGIHSINIWDFIIWYIKKGYIDECKYNTRHGRFS